MSSKSLFSQASSLFPKGVNSPVRYYEPYPRFIRSGRGSRITDEDGSEYIDYCLAFGPMILGHSNAAVVDGIKRQVETGISFGAPGRNEIELGDLIKGAIPSIEMMRFTNSGTEATMHALRLAKHFTSRKLILKVEGGFHGSHDMALNTIPIGELKGPENEGTIEVPFNDVNALREIFTSFGRHIAAFILEPVLGNIGVVAPDIEFLTEARKLTEEYGALLIFDEVITAFRFAFSGYQDIAGIKPDLTTLGKIIGGGLPVGLFGGRADIMRHVSPSGTLYQQGTFSGNPVTMAGGISTLQALSEADYSKPENYALKLQEAIHSAMKSNGVETTINRLGTMFTVFFTEGPVTDNKSAMKSNSTLFSKFFTELLKNGVFLPKSQFEACFVSFAHDSEDMAQTTAAVEKAAEAISGK